MDNMINLWHAGTGALLGTIDHLTEIGFPASTGSDKPASLGVSRWSLRGCDLNPDPHGPLIRLWDAKTGELLRTLDGPLGYTRCLSFSMDGRCVFGMVYVLVMGHEQGRVSIVRFDHDETMDPVSMNAMTLTLIDAPHGPNLVRPIDEIRGNAHLILPSSPHHTTQIQVIRPKFSDNPCQVTNHQNPSSSKEKRGRTTKNKMLFRTSTNTTTKCADQNQQASKPVAQNTTKNYLYRPALQALLEKLFPDQTDFSIEFGSPEMIDLIHGVRLVEAEQHH
ncbi:hypothetical protein PMAA_049270 [Talaromyces marneffei ATCC 18224]|uniref:Uncharacterized protein n=1 Tax=Talaromyces marneffei (strain ATCC 18224 / CBS 334.59 / QM 7333) TaxID=441960 RepID=B6QPA6_TALMQ|nr:hypothetical protein PMAA_049270 [Talaromyces marneffei ATCC 18224]